MYASLSYNIAFGNRPFVIRFRHLDRIFCKFLKDYVKFKQGVYFWVGRSRGYEIIFQAKGKYLDRMAEKFFGQFFYYDWSYSILYFG